MRRTHTLIIGAGPAGLAVAGRLRKAGQPFDIVEQSGQIASAWHKHYKRLHLHTVKANSHLPHLPFPKDYPQYVPRHLLVAYYEAYAKKFKIIPEFGQTLEALSPSGRKWVATFRSGQRIEAHHVVIATGVNRQPYLPKLEGQQDFEGRLLHSRDYREPAPFAGQRVLVVGMGNTGAEIALDLSEQGIKPLLCVRSPVNIVPRDFLGRPTQQTALALAKLPNWLGDWIGKRVQRLAFGPLEAYGLKQPDLAPAKQLRETGSTPVVDIGTVAAIKAGKIKVVPGISRLTPSGAMFEDGNAEGIDTIIFATGYRARLSEFLPFTDGLLNADGLPTSCIGQGPYQGLYFLGFDNYKPGGILGVIYEDSAVIAERIVEGH